MLNNYSTISDSSAKDKSPSLNGSAKTSKIIGLVLRICNTILNIEKETRSRQIYN